MLVVIGSLIGLAAGLVVGAVFGSRFAIGRRRAAADAEIARSLDEAKRGADAIRREAQVEVREEALRARAEMEAELTDRMHEVMAARAEKRVFFDIDDEATYGDAMHVMDVCRGSGAKTLGLVSKTQ